LNGQMRMAFGWVGVLAAHVTISIAAAGCGDGEDDGRDADPSAGGSGATSLPPSSSKLSDISDGQAAAFCGDLESIQGGYGRKTRTFTCGDLEVTRAFDLGANEAECKVSFTTLPNACSSLTTGQIKACVQEIWAATCESQDTPSCDPFVACAGGGS
jgi:hypothetical protein